MTKRTAIAIAYLAPLFFMVCFAPWNAHTDQDFVIRSQRVAIIAVLLHVALRYGLTQLVRRDPDAGVPIGDRSKAWTLIRTAVVAQMVIGILGVVLTTNHILPVDLGFLLEMAGQQLTVLFLVRRMTRLPNGGRIAGLLALGSIAIFFAWSSNIVFLAQKPPGTPMSSDSVNTLYAVPALALIALSLAERNRRR